MAKKAETNNEQINLDGIKEELTDYINVQIKKNFSEELERSNKRLIREKSKQVFIRNIIILVLLILIGVSVYLLYQDNYFNKYFNGSSGQTIDEKKDSANNGEEKSNAPTLEELKEKYASLLNPYKINEKSKYINDYYNGILSNDLKKYIAVDNMDFEKLEIEEDYNVIDAATLEKEYSKLFDDKIENNSFYYNSDRLRYISRMESYFTNYILERKDTSIVREITDIKLVDDTVIITTVEGLVKDQKLYNIISNEEVIDYKNDSLVNYKDRLNQVVYKFKDSKLIALSN